MLLGRRAYLYAGRFFLIYGVNYQENVVLFLICFMSQDPQASNGYPLLEDRQGERSVGIHGQTHTTSLQTKGYRLYGKTRPED